MTSTAATTTRWAWHHFAVTTRGTRPGEGPGGVGDQGARLGQAAPGRLGLLEQAEHGTFDSTTSGELTEGRTLAERVQVRADRHAVVVVVDHARVDVGRTAHGRGVAEVVRDLLDRPRDRPLAGGLTRRYDVGHRERHRAEHRRVPGAEVLSGEITPRDLAQVVVDVMTLDVDPAVRTLVPQQLRSAA